MAGVLEAPSGRPWLVPRARAATNAPVDCIQGGEIAAGSDGGGGGAGGGGAGGGRARNRLTRIRGGRETAYGRGEAAGLNT